MSNDSTWCGRGRTTKSYTQSLSPVVKTPPSRKAVLLLDIHAIALFTLNTEPEYAISDKVTGPLLIYEELSLNVIPKEENSRCGILEMLYYLCLSNEVKYVC